MPSSPQTVTTRGVFDYLYNSAGKAIVGATVNCTLNFNGSSVTSPIVNLGELQQATVTDQNGFWRFNLVPNDTITPTGTLYTINAGNIATYDISVPSGGADVQSSSILANVPSVLSPALTSLTGPISVAGNLTATGTLQGAQVIDTALTAGQVVFPGASGLTGDTNNFWDNTNKRLGIGTNTPQQALDVIGNVQIKGGQPWFDLKAFGAKGDGTTDDSTAVQNWVNAVAGSGANGLGIGIAPAGNYKLTTTITNPATLGTGLILVGAGREVTKFTQATTNIDTFKFAGSGTNGRVNNVILRDMSIYGPNSGTSGFLINMNGDLDMYDVWLTLGWTALRLTNSFYTHIEDSFVGNSIQDGVIFDNTTGPVTAVEFRGTRFSNNGNFGINGASPCTDLRIHGGTVESNGLRGLVFDGGNLAVLTLQGVYFEDNKVGALHDAFLGSTTALEAVSLFGCRFNPEGTSIVHCEIVNCKTAVLIGNYWGQSSTGAGLKLGANAKCVIEMGNNLFDTVTRTAGASGMVIGSPGQSATGQSLHLQTYGPAPTITGVNVGISGTPTVAGNDISGLISMNTTGSPPVAGTTLFTVNFISAYGAAPAVLGQSQNATTNLFVVVAVASGSFAVMAAANLPGTSNLTFAYEVIHHI